MNVEITKREVLASITIIAVMILLGMVIAGKIAENHLDVVEKYNKAVKIVDRELFEYGMRTNVGNALVYGELKAVDTVTYPEIGGEYMSVEKVKEIYTRHERTVDVYDDKGKKVGERIEEYWTWDYADSWSEECDKVTFLDVQFDFGQIYTPRKKYITTQHESFKVRFQYYGSDTLYAGTIFAVLKDKNINDVSFYNGKDIKATMEQIESGAGVIAFWIFWIILIGGCVYGFCYMDNNWLNK